MFHIHSILSEMNIGNNPEMVAGHINYPPFLPVFEIVHRRKDLAHCLRTTEFPSFKSPVDIEQGLPLVGIGLCCLNEWEF